jgi:hypothetical protein
VAIVAALGLLMLGAALLAGSAVASVELRRAARTRTASARAESEVRRGLAALVQGWSAELDSIPIGARVERAIPGDRAGDSAVVVRASIRRLTSSLYAASVSAQVGRVGAVLAFRRARLLVERPVPADSASIVSEVAPLARWSVVEVL